MLASFFYSSGLIPEEEAEGRLGDDRGLCTPKLSLSHKQQKGAFQEVLMNMYMCATSCLCGRKVKGLNGKGSLLKPLGKCIPFPSVVTAGKKNQNRTVNWIF